MIRLLRNLLVELRRVNQGFLDHDYVRGLREREFDIVRKYVGRGKEVLEIGAGAGWQSVEIEKEGNKVDAIDLEKGGLSSISVFPVRFYDGKTIPCENKSYDIVFSSNVLEHVRDVDIFQREIIRVLRDDGLAIHVLPSATWRVSTIFAHYLHYVEVVLLYFNIKARRVGPEKLISEVGDSQGDDHMSSLSSFDLSRLVGMISRVAVPSRHGERGNAVSEIYYFSRFWWARLFRNTGWELLECIPNRLFYTGETLLGRRLGLNARRVLSLFLGSSCLVYILRKSPTSVR